MKKTTSLALSLAAGFAMMAVAGTASAGEYHLIKTIQVPGDPIKTVDFSVLNQKSGLMYVTDRSNKGVDIINTKTDKYVGRYDGFWGVDAATKKPEMSGPNNSAEDGHILWVSDAQSTVRAVNMKTGKIIASVATEAPGANTHRIDGIAIDNKHHVLLTLTPDDDTPFYATINTKTHEIMKKVMMPQATGGEEGVLYDAKMGKFLMALPEVNKGPGAIVAINPKTGDIDKTWSLPAGDKCVPAGISLNSAKDEVAIGCDTADLTDILSLKDGHVDQIPAIGGTDQTAFDPARHIYFFAAREATGGPVLGLVDSNTHKWLYNVPTAKGTHAVAVNERNHKVYLPLKPNTDAFDNDSAKGLDCTHGCIGVYAE